MHVHIMLILFESIREKQKQKKTKKLILAQKMKSKVSSYCFSHTSSNSSVGIKKGTVYE